MDGRGGEKKKDDVKLKKTLPQNRFAFFLSLMVLYHLARAHEWTAAASASTHYTPPTFAADGGFVHLTADPAKLVAVGNAFYKHPADTAWVLIELPDGVGGDALKWEAAAPVGETAPPDGFKGETFPHLYAPIDPADAVRVLPVQRDADGSFVGVVGVTQ